MDNQNQYNFIMDPGAGNSSGPAFLRDPKKRIFAAIAFVTIIILVVAIVIGVLLSLGKSGSAGLKGIVAYQTEIIRISDIGLKDSKDINVKAKVGTLQSFMISDLNETNSLVVGKMSKEEVAQHRDSDIDNALKSALSSNSFDSEIIRQLDELIGAYQSELKTVYDSSSKDSEKKVLTTANNNIVVYEGL